MQIKGWKYYNHAAIPTIAPHETPDLSSIENGDIWKMGEESAPLLARWTTDWDCGYETGWYYVVKDSIFDIDELKAKRRYEIRKGCKNFIVRKINPEDYKTELLQVQMKAFSAYPESYRPRDLTTKNMDIAVSDWIRNGSDVFGTFRDYKSVEKNEEDKSNADIKENNSFLCALVGYSVLRKQDRVIYFDVEKTDPDSEKDGVNAATVYGILNYYKDELENGYYICDGEKPINHQTHFQDYLEKYFGFRKAYCKLNIKYKKGIGVAVKILYPFRKVLSSLDDNSMVHKINGVLKMEEIIREDMSRDAGHTKK